MNDSNEQQEHGQLLLNNYALLHQDKLLKMIVPSSHSLHPAHPIQPLLDQIPDEQRQTDLFEGASTREYVQRK